MIKEDGIEKPFRKTIGFVFVIYWAVLVAWQNASGTNARSFVDMVIKTGLLLYFVWSYIKRNHTFSKKILWVFLFAYSMLITAMYKEQFSISIIIAYIYPMVFLAMVYGIGDCFEIDRKGLICFCKYVIIITLYAAVYSLIFCREQFQGVISISSAYGNELSSFFISSHEYGMYLSAAIISCLLVLKLSHEITRWEKVFYIGSITIFIVNLILTFSRTSIFSMIIFLGIYVILERGNLKRWIVAGLVMFIIALIASPELRGFIYHIVLKGNRLGSRESLTVNAIVYYQNGTLFEKIFGHGISSTRSFFSENFTHSSIHNGYLQILLYYGVIGVSALGVFLFTQVVTCIKFIKKNRFLGVTFLGMLLMAIAIMFANTQMLFSSSIDSYFLTMFFIVIPKYVRNSVKNYQFDGNELYQREN